MRLSPSPIPPGAIPVLFTPFTEDNRVDYSVLEELADFYLMTGVKALFTACHSGEVFQLSVEESRNTTRRILDQVHDRMAIVSGANLGTDLDEQADSISYFQDLGVDASVIIVSMLPSPDNLLHQILTLASKTTGPLGIYECPYPEHRLLSVSEVKEIASTGRFVFMKETSRKVEVHKEKLLAAEGTPLRIFQANLRCLPASLDAGSWGHCGTVVNICPELCNAIFDSSINCGDSRRLIQNALQSIHDKMISHHYPASGKYILSRRGLKITPRTRFEESGVFSREDADALDQFLESFDFSPPYIHQESKEGEYVYSTNFKEG